MEPPREKSVYEIQHKAYYEEPHDEVRTFGADSECGRNQRQSQVAQQVRDEECDFPWP